MANLINNVGQTPYTELLSCFETIGRWIVNGLTRIVTWLSGSSPPDAAKRSFPVDLNNAQTDEIRKNAILAAKGPLLKLKILAERNLTNTQWNNQGTLQDTWAQIKAMDKIERLAKGTCFEKEFQDQRANWVGATGQEILDIYNRCGWNAILDESQVPKI